ncbi:mucoidy inhibitor MuiA family protein [Marinobacter sp. SS21]|uniref:mucoidy inhibitor MuiA family protein n=1 Tax=Marinobacter sp. SS21 TaxID=2979460 RepID=UPI00232F5315|nr:mucoidy inhibitor MuiA family protein [Marinobacter sp. SS21]MDC0661272.1 mucoidy inhibitor MuiA family protein [Marinobacter sp. SS21]
MQRTRLYVLLAAWLPLPTLAEVTAVTLYPNQAAITREEPAQLVAGAGTVEIRNLPAGLIDRTLRVAVLGDPSALVREVNLVSEQTTEAQASKLKELRTALQAVTDDIRAQDDAIRAWRYRLDLLDRLTTGNGEAPLPDDIDATADSLFQQAEQSLSNIRRIEQDKRTLVEEQDRIQRELDALQDVPRVVKHLSVGYSAERAVDVTLQIQYQTRHAGWASAYEARLDTDSSELRLVHQAVVHQNTGEDWREVQLALSTANPDVGGRLPDPPPWILLPPPQPLMGKAMEADEISLSAAPAREERSRAQVQQATLVTNGLTQHYQVPGALSLGDGTRDKRLTVSSYELPAKVSRRMVPALASLGYVYGEATYQGESTLPPAQASLFQDGQYVGQAWLQQTEPGTPIALSFGVDDRVTVKVIRDQDQRGEKGLISEEPYLERVNRFEISNAHDRPIDIRVLDRLPVSRHDDIEVSYQDITTPYQEHVDDKPGIIAWDRVIAPGRTITLTAGFEVRVPEGQTLPPLP